MCVTLLTASERFTCLGIPVKKATEVFHKIGWQKEYDMLGTSSLKRMAGNAMHISSIGRFIAWSFANVSRVDSFASETDAGSVFRPPVQMKTVNSEG